MMRYWFWSFLTLLSTSSMPLINYFFGSKAPLFKNEELGDFPGGTVVKNPPANAGDMSSISGPGRSHMPWSN